MKLRLPAAPLFLQALGLVLATLVAAEVATVVVVLNLPPPTPEIYSTGDVAAAYRAGRTIQTPDGRDLSSRIQVNPPARETEGRRRLRFRDEVAAALGVAPADVVVAQPGPRIVAFGPSPGPPHRRRSSASETPILFGAFKLGVRQADGRWRVIAPAPRLAIDPWQQRLLLVLAIAAAAVSPLAWWFARRLTAPIAALAAGAERLGRDPAAPPLAVRGSAEVMSAVGAFNEMQERLRDYVRDRTEMIGAIAHDLRTPLTRMRFRIEAAPEDLRTKLGGDIDQMEAMISATLGFVRDAQAPAQRVKLEISSLVESVLDEAAETGAAAQVGECERAVIDGDPVALRRLLANLVDNALKFGAAARARVFTEAGMAIVEIDDDGPGIAPEQIERAFQPFRRLEGSRNRDTGGIGLGLAVVRAIALGHGGEVSLANRASGGLTARVRLPLAARAD